MTPKQKIKASKFLSLLLRHKPDAGGITLDAAGWATCDSVIDALRAKGHPVTPSILHEIVAEDEKTRYALDPHTRRIRANQGHSVPIDLGLIRVPPPEYLFHGTADKTLWLILRDGLLPMARQHVHLSEDVATAIKVGKRHGEPVVITVKAAQMAADGYAFYRSDNGVWLTQAVPVDYLGRE